MAHGKRTTGAVTGAAAGAAAGPIGAIIGGAAGYGLASLGDVLGKKKAKPPVAKPSILPAVLIGGAGIVLAGVVIFVALRRK